MASPVNEKLLYASEQGNVEVIIEALKEGADANCVDAGMGYETPCLTPRQVVVQRQ
jgi:hypothetical protein